MWWGCPGKIGAAQRPYSLHLVLYVIFIKLVGCGLDFVVVHCMDSAINHNGTQQYHVNCQGHYNIYIYIYVGGGVRPFFHLIQLYLALKIVGYGINEAIDLPLMGFVFSLKMFFPFIF